MLFSKTKTALQTMGNWLLPAFLFITVVCLFLQLPIMPGEGLDSSWVFGMNQAVAQGFMFGRDFIYTLGPYASIYTHAYHPAIDKLIVWSSLYFGLSFGFVVLLLFKESKQVLQLALLIALAGLDFSDLSSSNALFFYYPLLVGAYTFRLIERNAKPRPIILAILFLPFGLLPLIKGNALIGGASIGALVFLLLTTKKYWKSALVVCTTPFVALIFFWLVSGQPLNGLPLYFTTMFPLIWGYTDAMAANGKTTEMIFYLITSILLLWVLFKKSAQTAKYDAQLKNRLFLLSIFFVTLFLAFKEGFVRHDSHAIAAGTFIVLAALLATAIYPSIRTIGVLFISMLICLYIGSHNDSRYLKNLPINIQSTYTSAWSHLKTYIDGKNELKHNFEETITKLHAKTDFPVLKGTTDIYPYDQSYLFASGNTWNPRPIFQSCSAYRPVLVEENKRHLLGKNAPDNLIFKVAPIDNRMPSLDDGASWPVILSHYQLTGMKNDFLFLKRTAKPLVIPGSIAHKESHSLGSIITLPQDDAALYAKITIKQTLLGKLFSIIYKPSQLQITLNLKDGSFRNYRLIAGMAHTGFLISPVVENTTDFGLLYADNRYLSDKKVKSFSIDVVGGKKLWHSQYELELIKLALPEHPQIVQLFDFQHPITLKPHLAISKAEKCDGSVDVVNGVNVNDINSNMLAHFSVSRFLNVNGWLAISTEKELLPQTVKIVLTGVKGDRYFIDTSQTLRLDVGMYFKNKQLDTSGYTATADISKLQGQYTLELAYQDENGSIKICHQFHIPLKLKGG